METSTLITIIYFCVNILLLLILTIYIIRTGEHYEAKSLGKDVWSQRKIYLPLIVHFYDAATDLGVVYYFHGLYVHERDGVYDYESVDMAVFFWCGLAFLALYRVILFITTLYGYFMEEGFNWYDPILVVLHLYVFRTVHESYNEAQETIKKNIKTREKNKQIRAKSVSQTTSSTEAPSNPDGEAGSTPTATTEAPIKEKLQKEEDIEADGWQASVLLIESVTESLPQIMLQSVFIIRSYNDPKLQDTNIWLLLLSVFASLLSISDKFVKFDGAQGAFEDNEYTGKSPKFESMSKGLCFNIPTMWYAIRVIWRICHIGSGFCIYVLVWTVMGGDFLPIWCCVVYLLFGIVVFMEMGVEWETVLLPIANFAGILELKWPHLAVKWMTGLVGLVVIAVFASTHFECVICAEAAQRNFENEIETGETNHRIAIFFALGCGSFLMDIVLFFVMHCGLDIIE